jgi:signal transduction histidine kinase
VRRVPIRIKLVAALAVPLSSLLVISVLEVRSISRDVADVRVQSELTRAAVGPAGVITRLQDERAWPALELTGSEGIVTVAVESYEDSRRLTDEAIAAFRADLAARGDAAVEAYADALDNLDALDQLRADIDADQSSPLHGDTQNSPFADEVYSRYTELIRPFFEATDQVAAGIDHSDLRRGTELVNLSSRQVELFAALARTLLVTGTVGGGVDTPQEIERIVALKAPWDAHHTELVRASAPFDTVVADHYPEGFAEEFSALVDRALSGEQIEVLDLLAPFESPNKGGLSTFRVALADELNEIADATYADARASERVFLALVVVTLAAAFALTWLVSRSITVPLRSLTRQAKEMAEVGLPAGVNQVLQTPLGEDVTMPRIDQVEVRSRDEVRDVVAALRTVQATALELAVEQAVLRRNIADSFVNLGRRNQNLLSRQIDFITALEHRETDPDALANLFRLDHLATRMRRNAESLLVLAGVEPSRQWRAPVAITDAVRAALGEVEDYQRVVVRGVEPATVVGSSAADLAHLLAELVENALAFSPDDRPVEVFGRHRHDGGYSVAISDAGTGMSPAELDSANRRLAGAESFTVSPSKYLGHYVAGKLAARNGIGVNLVHGRGGRGIVACIELPPELVAGGVSSPGRGALPPGSWGQQPVRYDEPSLPGV